MNEKRYSIVLADDTTINNLRLNGTNFISNTAIDLSIFEGNCSPVKISDGETVEIHENMTLCHVMRVGAEYWVALRDISESELAAIRYAATARYLKNNLTDEDAAKCIDLFPAWSSNSKNYGIGERVRYGKQLYKCLQTHVSQPTWSPTAAASLWTRVDDPSVEWPEWVQPTGAHDAYAVGYKVSHNKKHWVSDIDANVWEPGVAGWTEQS